MKTSSSVETQATVSQHHLSVTMTMIVETGLMNRTAVSGISAYLIMLQTVIFEMEQQVES